MGIQFLHVCMNYYSFKFCIYTSSYIQVHGIVAHIYPLELMQFMYKEIIYRCTLKLIIIISFCLITSLIILLALLTDREVDTVACMRG